MIRFFRKFRVYLRRFCRVFFINNREQFDMRSYSACRAVLEDELHTYSKHFGFKVRQSKLSGNVWRIYVDGFHQAFIFYTRVIGLRAYITSKCAGNYRYICKIDEHTTLLFTDKIRRDSAEVANLYLSDNSNPDNKRMQIRFIRSAQKNRENY